jgi:WD40 repeat protein/serine/threonine protein kinase
MNTFVQPPAIEIESLVAEAADRFTDEIKQGRAPSIDDYAAQYPDIAPIIRQVFPALAVLDEGPAGQAARSDSPTSATGEVLGEGAPAVGLLGDFRILREVGRGGMGVVYEAEQISLGRRVALKVLPFAAMLDRQQLARFKNEARAAATLDHPNIVAIYSVGAERGVHYYAMQLIEGQSLAEVIATMRQRSGVEEQRSRGAAEQSRSGVKQQTSSYSTTPPLHSSSGDTQPVARLTTLPAFDSREYFRAIAQLGIQAAEALDHAHQNGVLHRDIKPANLLVECKSPSPLAGTFKTPSPLGGGPGSGSDDASHLKLWITDFGLARMEQDAGMTMTGDLLGTLRYMSPEQALAKRVVIDHRSDIYSLGVTLYELLTLQPAYAATDRQELLRQIAFDDPRKPRQINSNIPKDLETIVLKAIEKEPHARYDSAADLAADIERFCEHKPIRARRTSRTGRLWRWSKRNRLVAALSITVATLITLVAITAPMIAWQQARLVDETRQQLYVKDMAVAYNAWNDGDLGQARELLARYAARSDFADYRDFPWYYLNGLYQRATASFMPGGKIALSRSTNMLAVARRDDLIYLYEIENWREVGTLPWKFTANGRLTFSPDGRFLVANYPDATLSVWEVATRKHLYAVPADSNSIEAFGPAFSPDGLIMATGGQDPDVKIWETKTGKLLRTLPGHSDDLSALAFSPDGKTLATASYDQSLRLWDTENWQLRAVIEDAFAARINALAYDPTGTRLASGGYGNEVTIWDASGQQITSLPSSGSSICFSPDGRLLAVAGALKGTVQVWDIETRKLTNDYLVGHSAAHVAFLSNQELLCEADFKLMRRNLDDSARAIADQEYRAKSDEIAIDVSGSGDLLVAGYGRDEADPGEGAIACWDLRSGTHRLLSGHDGSSVFDVAIDPTGEWIVASGGPRHGPGFVKIWHSRTGALTESLPKEDLCVGSVAISPAGDRLAIAALKHVAVYHDLSHQPKVLWKREKTAAIRVAFSPHGDVVAVACFGHSPDVVSIWDAELGEQLETASLDRPILDVAFSPDSKGRLLASIDWSGKVEVYDRQQRRTLLSEPAHQWTGRSVAFSHDGRTLATGSSSGEVKLWHIPTMMHITTFGTRGGVAELKFFPDGKTLAVGYTDRTIELWHVDREMELLNIDGAVEPHPFTSKSLIRQQRKQK